MSAQIYRPCIVRLIENKISQAWLVSSLNKILKKKENKHSKTKTLTREQKRGEKHHLGGGGAFTQGWKRGMMLPRRWCSLFNAHSLWRNIFLSDFAERRQPSHTLVTWESESHKPQNGANNLFFIFFFLWGLSAASHYIRMKNGFFKAPPSTFGYKRDTNSSAPCPAESLNI